MMASWLSLALLASPIIYALWRRLLQRHKRRKLIPRSQERVLIIGASSGIGRSIAIQYAENGARICIIGRRQNELEIVESECLQAKKAEVDATSSVISISADFTKPQDMVRVRSELEAAWGGLDTVLVCAGVSAIRSLLEVAGLENPSSPRSKTQASPEDIQHVVDIVDAASRGNFTGPLVAALTFIPLLQFSSKCPSILLVSSLAAIIPAPTRSIYASTKGAALLLYQSLAIEHPTIAFSFVIPGTVQGDFRASAVDAAKDVPVSTETHNKGLKRDAVAKRCIEAIDAGDKFVFMPVLYGRAGHILYWWLPWIVEWAASRKYKFSSS